MNLAIMPSWSELEMSQILECGYFSTVGILALWVIVGYCGLLWVTVGILVSPKNYCYQICCEISNKTMKQTGILLVRT